MSFVGELVAEVTTASPRKTRWTECYLYLTESGKFVSYTVGRSKNEGEIDIHTAYPFSTFPEAVNFFRNDQGELSWVTGQIIKQASINCPQHASQMTERV